MRREAYQIRRPSGGMASLTQWRDTESQAKEPSHLEVELAEESFARPDSRGRRTTHVFAEQSA